MKIKFNKEFIKEKLLLGGIALSTITVLGVVGTITAKSQDSLVSFISSARYKESSLMSNKRFAVGEHVVSVPISNKSDVLSKNVQYEYHNGYEPIGITVSSSYSSDDVPAGSILYANTTEVDCFSYLVNNDGEYCYTDFGIPVLSLDNGIYPDEKVKDFEIGQHIISVPIKTDARFSNIQYNVPEGYKMVGFASISNSKTNLYAGGVALYTNVKPVICNQEENGYTSFGQILNQEKTFVLNK